MGEDIWKEPHTSCERYLSFMAIHKIQTISFIILTRAIRIQAKPLHISLDLFSANMQNIHAFFLHLSDIFHPEKTVFHTFISIMVILPYLHFHFF